MNKKQDLIARRGRFLSSFVRDATPMNTPPKKGRLFGVEVECEGRNVYLDQDDGAVPAPANWRAVHDGSLRNVLGPAQEWVINQPRKLEDTLKNIDGLYDYFAKRKAQLVPSSRTSIHVHINMADRQVIDVYNLFILYSILDGVLERFCGEGREGNLFCLSSRFAQRPIGWMEEGLTNTFMFHHLQVERRYSSLNLMCLQTYGTAEFRAMRLLVTAEETKQWVTIIDELSTYVFTRMNNPVDIIQRISEQGPGGFIHDIFSPANAAALLAGWDREELRYNMYEGLRLLQPMSYLIAEAKVERVEEEFWPDEKEDEALDEPVAQLNE